MFKRTKICDICGQPFYKGIKIQGLGKKKEIACEKCENVMKLMILKYRRKRGE
jgi:hypothetical protein